MLTARLKNRLLESGLPVVIYRSGFMNQPNKLGEFTNNEAIKTLEKADLENYDLNEEYNYIELFIE